jgi:hypothetical protein
MLLWSAIERTAGFVGIPQSNILFVYPCQYLFINIDAPTLAFPKLRRGANRWLKNRPLGTQNVANISDLCALVQLTTNFISRTIKE